MRIIALAIGLVTLVALAACSSPTPTPTPRPTPTPQPTPTRSTTVKRYSSPPAMAIDTNKRYVATLETSLGTIEIELLAQEAPITVNNFVFLAREGFYDGTVFHRIIKGFMIQGGDPLGNGTGGPGYTFKDEPVTRDYTRGTMAMANAGPNTNGSQFFIMHANYALPKSYTIFGQVIAGLDVVDKLASVPVRANVRGELSAPLDPPILKKATITETSR